MTTDAVTTIERIARRTEQRSNEGFDTISIPLTDMYELLTEFRTLQSAIMPFAAAANRPEAIPTDFADEACISLPVAISAYKRCIWLNNTKIA